VKREITFNAVGFVAEQTLRRVLDDFEVQRNVHVNLHYIPWENYRSEFTNISLHQLPGDVAVTGTPATSDLIAMNALRPFSRGEIAALGGEAAFLPSRWRAGQRPGEAETWAVPFVVDPRILYYRRDLLARAGVDEATAFATPAQVEQTIQKLQDCGVEVPWMALLEGYGPLHRAASWIWAYGGDLFTPDGRRAMFHEKEALEGLRAYLRLTRFIPPDAIGQDIQALLTQGRAGVAIDKAFVLYSDPVAEIGCAPTPGGSYIGGSDLMIWKYAHHEDAALELVRYLTRTEVVGSLLAESNYLPARVSDLQALAAQPIPMAQEVAQATFTGRTFPCVPMIGLIEERLNMALLSIQQELLKNPHADLEALLRQRIVTMGNRTNISLGSLG
jgi:multiple sugar transport system substrate-binding protein